MAWRGGKRRHGVSLEVTLSGIRGGEPDRRVKALRDWNFDNWF
jgi:hypothetical protein